jgi:hypothetical protein
MSKNDIIIQMNQVGKTFYVILTGSVSIKIPLPEDGEKEKDEGTPLTKPGDRWINRE